MLTRLSDDPVVHFLVLCLRGRFDDRSLDEARAWRKQQGLDWKDIDVLATRELLTPILYSLLRKQNWPPADILARWHQSYLRTGLINTLTLAELAKIGRAFDASGIPFILLKGAALLGLVYSNIALRPMADVDLLIHREELLQATEVIRALGYVSSHPEEHPGMFLAYENEIALERPGERHTMVVELHWSLIDSPYYQDRLPMTWFWETAMPGQVGEVSVLMLGPEALLLHLVAHFMLHHHGEGLRWLHDVAEVLFHFSALLDWDLLLDRTACFHLALPMQRVIPLVTAAWRVPIPAATLEALNRLEASPDEKKVFRQATSPPASSARRFLADLSTLSGRRQQMRFLWRKLFPSPAYMRHRYGVGRPWTTAFYYPYRWWLGISGIISHETTQEGTKGEQNG